MKQLLNTPSKILWIDTETTGLDAHRNGIWQIGAEVEVDGEILERVNLKMCPRKEEKIDAKALIVGGTGKDELKNYPPAERVMKVFKEFLAKHVDKYNKDDKFVPAGYCVGFDLDMLRASFEKDGDKYFGSWFFNAPLDVRSYVALLPLHGFRFADYKLATICEGLGIPLKAHDALEDIVATRRVFETVRGLIGKNGGGK